MRYLEGTTGWKGLVNLGMRASPGMHRFRAGVPRNSRLQRGALGGTIISVHCGRSPVAQEVGPAEHIRGETMVGR